MWDFLLAQSFFDNFLEAGRWTDTTVYFVMGSVGTLLFLLKLLLLLIGGVDDTDFDVGEGGTESTTGGFSLFSLLSILSFMMGAGWLGLACRAEWNMGPLVSALAASGFGFSLMMLSSVGMYQMKKFNQVGRYDVRDCIGKTARVYMRIPPKGEGRGQVQVNVDGRSMILSAVSTGAELQSFTAVRVLEVRDDDVLTVEAI